jgi:hypothetical protein
MSWLDDDSIYSIFNKPNHRGPGTHFDEDKAYVSSKPIPASGGAEKEDILLTDFMPSAAEVKKESNELFDEVGNQGGHAGNTAADDGDEDDDEPARPAGRGGARPGAGRKRETTEVKAAKAAVREDVKNEAKAIAAARLAAVKANLSAAVDTPSEGGGEASGGAAKPPKAVRRASLSGVGPGVAHTPLPRKSASAQNSRESSPERTAPGAPVKDNLAKTLVFGHFKVEGNPTKSELSDIIRGSTVDKLRALATDLKLEKMPKSSSVKNVWVEAILSAVYG